jgi:hypothetical protein
MFINTNEVYQISLTKEEKDFLEILQSEGDVINCLIFSTPIAENSEEQALVHKILAAAKLEINQYVIIDIQKFPHLALRYFDVHHFPNVQHVIGFGVDAKQIGLNTINPKFQYFTLGRLELVLVDDAATLLGDSRKKAVLWSEMKKMFEIV